MKGCLCNTSPQGGEGLSGDSVTFRECCFTGFGDTEATSHGMQTRCGFLTVSAALNKRVPSSQGIETTQFHSVLLCCQLAFNIPLSPQKPQHRSFAWMLYNRGFHSCFGTCNPRLTSAMKQRKHLPKSMPLGTVPSAAVEARQVGIISMLAEKGGGWILGTKFLLLLWVLWRPTACARCQALSPTPLHMSGASMGTETTEPNVSVKVPAYKPQNLSSIRRLAWNQALRSPFCLSQSPAVGPVWQFLNHPLLYNLICPRDL